MSRTKSCIRSHCSRKSLRMNGCTIHQLRSGSTPFRCHRRELKVRSQAQVVASGLLRSAGVIPFFRLFCSGENVFTRKHFEVINRTCWCVHTDASRRCSLFIRRFMSYCLHAVQVGDQEIRILGFCPTTVVVCALYYYTLSYSKQSDP